MTKQDLIERKQYMQQLRNLKDQNIIKVITGVRRCGKSTLLMMFADELAQNGIPKEQIQFYNFEDLDTLAIGDIYQIHTHIKERLVEDKPNYIFLDEVQNVKEFQRLVDSLYIKPNVDVYITGSNAYMLSGELATLLTGRYVEINILPLQFSEYYNFIMSKSPNLTKIETLANYIHYGGVPEVDFVVTDNDGYTSYYQVAWTTESPETLERELASLKAIKDSNPKYLLTTDFDFNPVYDGIRKLNVIDWMLQ
ncbi:MAG: AAA family ATPase [Bacteroidales bacterium]|nr:AAA family ATPase [Bacteroidales bacterium]